MTAPTAALIAEAQEAYQTEEYGLAARKYAAAEEALSAAGDKLMAAEMANNRSVALLKLGDAAGAHQAALGTEEVFAAAGDLRRQAIALSNQASAMEALGKPAQAVELYRQASQLFKSCGESDMRAFVLKSISMLQFRTGQRLEALATMRAALESQRKLTLREKILKGLLNTVFRLMGGK